LDEDEDESEEDDLGVADDEQGEYTHAPYERRTMESSWHGSTTRDGSVGERTSLLGPGGRAGSKTRHRRTKSGPGMGTASVTQAVLMVSGGCRIGVSQLMGRVAVEGLCWDRYTVYGEGVSSATQMRSSDPEMCEFTSFLNGGGSCLIKMS